DIIKEMYIVARTLKPSPSGIPLEIYCFTTSTLWKDYENTQSAIFEYITAVAGQFSLRLYQYPAGHDFWRLSQEHAARTGLPPSAEG
ncbi:mechanosensitive ion channel, partial [Escherichia coli]|nr:mechanosensitive ion channel [Escherichia coli]